MATPKGSRTEDEVREASTAAQVLGARLFVVPFNVPGPEQKLVIAVKQRATPDVYPRRDGVPAKSPL
jgi:16S rRNA (guanine527-N7)-methyltransferase